MNFSERPIIITDVETTGLNPRLHETIEIGAVKVDHNLLELDRFDVKVKPYFIERAEAKALEINGYNARDWEYALEPWNATTLFSKFARDGILCAWNITFEYGFLEELFRTTQVFNSMDYHRIDIPSIAWAKFPGLDKIGLDAIGARFGLAPEVKPHRGINGALYEWEVLYNLLNKGSK